MTVLPILEAEGLSHRTRDGKPLVADVTIQVHPGEILVLAGPNGAGKSTLLKVLAGLLPRSEGSLRLFGDPIDGLSGPKRARRTAFVGQSEIPDPRLTVAEYIALGRIPRRWDGSDADHRSAVAAAVTAVGLDGKATDPMGRLSGGEAQRAAIARALCQEPEILFLDEPTNHLDPKAKGDLLSLIAGLGIAVVCVLHDLSLIPALASHVVLLDQAAPVATGPTAEVLTSTRVRQIFDVDFLQLSHPETGRPVAVVDIPVHSQPNHEQEY